MAQSQPQYLTVVFEIHDRKAFDSHLAAYGHLFMSPSVDPAVGARITGMTNNDVMTQLELFEAENNDAT